MTQGENSRFFERNLTNHLNTKSLVKAFCESDCDAYPCLRHDYFLSFDLPNVRTEYTNDRFDFRSLFDRHPVLLTKILSILERYRSSAEDKKPKTRDSVRNRKNHIDVHGATILHWLWLESLISRLG